MGNHKGKFRREQQKFRIRSEHANDRDSVAVAPKLDANNLIIGRNCLLEVLRHKPSRILRVFCAVGENSHDSVAQEILLLTEQQGVKLEKLTNEQLSKIANTDSHQSFAAEIKARIQNDLKVFLENSSNSEKSLVLALDAVVDPQNLGTLLRAAECFGAAAVVWSKNRCASLTPVVAKASVGASELLECLIVSNLADSLKKFKDAGYWIITGSLGPEAQDLNKFEFPAKSVIVLGAEGEGVSRLVHNIADFKVYIALFGKIQSLNVSQACSVLLHSYRTQHRS